MMSVMSHLRRPDTAAVAPSGRPLGVVDPTAPAPETSSGPAATEPTTPRSAAGPWLTHLTSWPVLAVTAALGCLVIGLSYRISGTGGSAQLYYAVFWLGMLIALLPTMLKLVRVPTSRRDRALALLLMALVTDVPKYLRNPAGPLYHDEYAHWREASDVIARGALFQPNGIIPIVQFYPGTSALTTVIHALSGLRVWESGLLLILSAHVLTFFAVLVLAQAHLRSSRAAAIAALVYSLNSSVLYFDTQYAYESVTMAWFLWVLALTSLAAREPRRGVRRGLMGGAVVCAAATIVTHHLTSLSLIGVLLLVTIVVGARPRVVRWADRRPARSGSHPRAPRAPRGSAVHDPDSRDSDDSVPPRASDPRAWLGVTTAVLAMAALWLGMVAWPTVAYLSPYAGTSVTQLTDIASGDKEQTGRKLLAASVQPLWERGFAGLAPLLVAAFCAWGALLLWRQRRRWSGDTLALALFGLVYFPSVAFILAPMGAEGARRSWAFTYAGLAMVVALAVTHPPRPPRRLRRVPGAWWPRLAVLSLVAVLIGNVAAGLNDPYRFPGPFTWGSDTNSASAEARTVAQQLDITVGNVNAVSDRYTGLALSAYGGVYVATPSTGFPAAELAQTDHDPTPALVGQLLDPQRVYKYLIVDLRMTEEPAFNGDNFGSADPLTGEATPKAFLERLDAVPWASRVMSTQHLRVYRLDLGKVGQTLRTSS